MKKHILYRNLFYMLVGILMASCSKMDATYKQFVVPNGISYIGKADSVHVFSGRQRVKITWLRGTDPKTNKAIIYWNSKLDSIVVPITNTNPNDTVSVIINHVPEGSYTFNIYTFDKSGHTSIQVNVLGKSYDSLYRSSLLVRPIDSAMPDGKDVVVKWLTADATSIGSEVYYTDITGQPHQVYVPSDSVYTILKNFKLGTSFRYRTLYKPDPLCIDSFYTGYDSLKVELLPQDINLALNKSIADKSSDGGSGRATELIDGDQATHWQPLGSDRRDDKMVWVTIDLGNSQSFDELNQFWTHGHQHIDSFTVLYSDDNNTWKVATAVKATPEAGENKTSFLAVKGRYVKLELHFSDDGNVNIAEVGIYNIPQAPPENLALNKDVEQSSGGSKPASNTVDGDNSTYWQPLSADRKDDKMISLTIDLGSSLTFDELDQYWTHGHDHINSYTVSYSNDEKIWEIAYQSASAPDAGANKATFAAVTGRYVKLELHFDTDGNVNIGEVEVWYR